MAITSQPQPLVVADTEAEISTSWPDNTLVFCKDTTRLLLLSSGSWIVHSNPVSATGRDSIITVAVDSSLTGGSVGYNQTVLVNTTLGTINLTLPSAIGKSGLSFYIKKIAGVNNVVINTVLTQTIDGGSSATLRTLYSAVRVVSDNLNWYIV